MLPFVLYLTSHSVFSVHNLGMTNYGINVCIQSPNQLIEAARGACKQNNIVKWDLEFVNFDQWNFLHDA